MNKKKLTQREKKYRAETKKELQQQGIIPQDKPRLNRKRFAAEVLADFEQMDVIHGDVYLRRAIGLMVGADMRKVSAEEVGVLKLLKLAIETSRFEQSLKDAGETKYSMKQYFDEVVLPILNL